MRLSIICGLVIVQVSQLVSAQDVPNCGPAVGDCAPGECCSKWGFCGTTPEHCGQAPPSPPTGGSSNIARPHIGNVPYGTIINKCNSPGKIALTFDDGPSEYTSQLLDILSSLNAKATFFLTGVSNRGPLTDPYWSDLIRRTHNEGHQIANHGWTHASLPSLSYDAQKSEIINVESSLLNILGFFPTYYRCAYLECDSNNGLPVLSELGYHVIGVNADTKDYLYDAPELVQYSQANFASLISRNPDQDSYISLAHDIRRQTVIGLTRFMVENAREKGYELVTVGECLGDPRANWYRGEGQGGVPPTTAPAPSPGNAVSTNGLCAGNGKKTCKGSVFGDCCSQWGYCGSSDDFCGSGCNRSFGSCS